MTSPWFTIGQIAKHLQVSREKIYILCRQGKMPAFKVGGQWRFDVEEIDAWVRQSRQKQKRSHNLKRK